MIYLLLSIYLLNLYYIKKRSLYKSSFFIHFFFISIIFIGPAIYYELGFTTYAHTFEWEDVIFFEKYGVIVFCINLIFLYLLAHKKKSVFNKYFESYHNRNDNLTFVYFIFWFVLVLAYLIFYFNHLPLVNFILTGSLPDRLDQSDSVKLFYTFSSFFMVFVPSGYFFFIQYLKSNFSKFLLLLLVVFILISGGHKGLVTFFIIFALLFSGYKFNFKRLLISFIALIGLLSIYTLTKGKEFNKETFYYLLESPPRRFFVTQGSAFITRISMDRRDLYVGNVHEYQLIKRETFQAIYPGTNDRGAAPTMFLGDLHVRYGFYLTIISYLFYLILLFPIIKGTDNMKKRYLYIWWNLFIFFFLTGMAEFSTTSVLRMGLAIFNLFFLLIIPLLRLKNVQTA